MKIYLDACAIIYWVEMSQPFYGRFAEILYQIKKKYKKPLFVASHLSLLECRVKSLRERDDVLLKQYQQFFCARDLSLIPLTLETIEKATELRAHYHLRTPDALQAATALSISDNVIFVTGDSAFKKIPKLEILLVN
jgi:predicted nucleic acid-binding protein